MTKDQEEILLQYTNKLDEVQTIPHHEYVKASGEKVSRLLDAYHIIWFHDDPGKMYMVKREG